MNIFHYKNYDQPMMKGHLLYHFIGLVKCLHERYKKINKLSTNDQINIYFLSSCWLTILLVLAAPGMSSSTP